MKPLATSMVAGVVGAAGGLGVSYIAIPPEVVMPWYGYLVVSVLNAVIGFAFVYFAPKTPV
jgi:hypothetical protein